MWEVEGKYFSQWIYELKYDNQIICLYCENAILLDLIHSSPNFNSILKLVVYYFIYQ